VCVCVRVQEFDTVKQFTVTVATGISLVSLNTYDRLTNSMKKGSYWEGMSRRDIREIPCLLQNRWVDNAFMTTHYWNLSSTRCIQSTFRHVSLRFILVLPSYICFGHPSNCFPSGFPAKILYAYRISPSLAKRVFHTPWFAHPNSICWRVQIMKTHYPVFFTAYCYYSFVGPNILIIPDTYINFGRSQWPRGLRHKPSSPARTLGSWVLIPLEAWKSVCVYSVCVVPCVGSGLATGWSPVQGVLPIVYRIKKLKNRLRSKGLYNHRERDINFISWFPLLQQSWISPFDIIRHLKGFPEEGIGWWHAHGNTTRKNTNIHSFNWGHVRHTSQH
jgi:hypothetical protein